MRLAILIVIMDFLVSSLLLFITGPEDWRMTGGGTEAASVAAAEFSPAALAALEARWLREAQEAVVSRKLLTQETDIARLHRESADLEAVKSSLETALDRERQALQAKAQQLDQQAREAERLRQEQERLAAAVREREQTIVSQQDSIAALTRSAQRLEDLARRQDQVQTALVGIQAGQQALSTNLVTLQQQGTLAQDTLSEVAGRQSAMTLRLGELQSSQTRMEATLDSVHTLAANLPAALQAGLQGIARDQQRLETSVAGLAGALPALTPVGSPADFQGFEDKLSALSAQHAALQQALYAMITGRTDQIAGGLSGLRQNQDAMQSDLKALAARVEDIGAKRPGPFRPFRDARVELRVALTEEFRGSDVTERQFDTYATILYPPLLSGGDRLWIPAGYRDLGLDWTGITSDLRFVYYRVAQRGGAMSALLQSSLRALAENPRVVLIPFAAPDDPALTAAGITNVAPMAILGRDALERRGTDALHLFKRSSEGLSFAIEAALDMNDPRYLVVRRSVRAWTGLLQKAFTNPNARPEPGDFVVTDDGQFVGVMTDAERCLVLAEDPLKGGEQAIPVDTLPAFVNEVLQLRRALR